MKSYRFLMVAVASVGLFSAVSVASHVYQDSFSGVPLPGVDHYGDLYCFGGEGTARVKLNTKNGKGSLRVRGSVYNDSGHRQRYSTNALLDSCLGYYLHYALDYAGLDVDDIKLRARYKVSKKGNAKGVARLTLPKGLFD